MIPRSDAPVYQESYYADASITTRLAGASDAALGCVLVIGGALLGWYARGLLAMPYDYRLLMLVTIVACFIVASRRTT
jgi:hypothetical protein